MFDSLQNNLNAAFKTLTGKARLTEANMRDGLSMIRDALLEADVSYPVVKDFIDRVSEQALGEKVLSALKPTEHLIHIVHQELINLMGPVDASLHLRGETPVLMMCGLQGSGKTTTCGKLAMMLSKRGKKPLLVGADLQRPAAMEQLRVLGEQVGVPVYIETGATNPVAVCKQAKKQAKAAGADVIILDTAGRLHVDDGLMRELAEIDSRVEPDQVYLVVDGMTGQDAVNSAQAFNAALELDGVIMTKLDGDARGGAALSVKHVTGVPIKFIGTGEHLQDLEEFRPEGMAGRILGQGDIMSLIGKAADAFDEDAMREQEERLREGKFTLDDFRKQLDQVSRMGPLGKVMELIPGFGGMKDMMGDVDADGDMKRLRGVIDSMTPEEKRNPTKVIDQSRRRRIAAGAGVEPHEVNELVKQFAGMAQMMEKMSGMGMRERMKHVQGLAKGGMLNPGAQLAKQKQSTGKRLSANERKALQKQRAKEAQRRRKESKNKRKS